MDTLKALQDRQAELLREARAIVDGATAEGREMTEDEIKDYDAKVAAYDDVAAKIQREQALRERERAAATPAVEPVPAGATPPVEPVITGGEDRARLDPNGGFTNYGEFCQAVFNAGRPNGMTDPRLVQLGAAPTTFGSEGVGEDGGFLVPPNFSATIREHSLEEDAFLPMTDQNPISGNTMAFPADETTPWGSGSSSRSCL